MTLVKGHASVVAASDTSSPLEISSDYTFTEDLYEPIVVMADNLVIDGNGYTLQGPGSGTGISLTGRSNVTIKNLRITRWENGITLSNSSRNTLTDNILTQIVMHDIATFGIRLEDSSSNNTVSSNTLTNSSGGGIFIRRSSNNRITNNTISHTHNGISLISSSNNRITNNTLAHNYGLTISGNSMKADYALNNMISGNTLKHTANGISITFFAYENSVVGNTITNTTWDGIYLGEYSANNRILDNTLTHTLNGISLVRNPMYNTISGNIIINSIRDGIHIHGHIVFRYETNNHISGNTITNSKEHGIYIDGSSHNRLSNNTIEHNGYGIQLQNSSYNVIYHNAFINNTVQTSDENPAENHWYNPELFEGNYWADYPGTDINGDRIGDTNRPWPGTDYDDYPIVRPTARPYLAAVVDTPPKLLWNRTYGGSKGDQAFSVTQTVDSGFVLAGETFIYGVGWDAWLLKTDANGTEEWQRTYGGTRAHSVIQTTDGGFVLAGGKSNDFWLVKTDASGVLQWNRTYDGHLSGVAVAHSVIETKDGDFAFGGYTLPYGKGLRCNFTEGATIGAGCADAKLVKTDASGVLQWNRTYGGSSSDYTYSVIETGDGGFMLAGYTNSYGAGGNDAWLVKTDASGNMEWQQTYGGSEDDCAYAGIKTVDGGFALAGSTQSYGTPGRTDFWLVKTNAYGNVEWNQTYDEALYYGNAFTVIETADGGFALAGTRTPTFGPGVDTRLVKTDVHGAVEWTQTYGGAADEYVYAGIQTTDGGFTLAGALSEDIWLMRTQSPLEISSNYTFTKDLDVPIKVIADNLVIDGNGYTLKGPGLGFKYGIYLNGRNNITITNITVIKWPHGIYLDNSSNIHISGNIITHNNRFGITLWHSSTNNSITGNLITNTTWDGISIWYSSSNNSILGNTIMNTESSIHIEGSHSTYNRLSNNTITYSTYGILIGNSSFNLLSNNTIAQNKNGILLKSSLINRLSDNVITNSTEHGIYLEGSSYNSISSNTITHSTEHGINLEMSSNISISDNTIAHNGYGIQLQNSSSIVIYHNAFLDNGVQAVDSIPAANHWHHPELLEGNYWSDYPGVDDGSSWDKHAIAGDGIGDTYLPWPEANYDDYPIVDTTFLLDTDDDGLSDWVEMNTYGTNPTAADTDGDGLMDEMEVNLYQTDPTVSDADADTDGDGLLNIDEVEKYGTNPMAADTDNDGVSDAAELEAGTDPLDLKSGGKGFFIPGFSSEIGLLAGLILFILRKWQKS